MIKLGSLLLLVNLLTIVFTIPNRPPSIYVQAPYDVYYKVDESVEIQCIADGVPAPRYNWTRNGIIFSTSGNDNRMVMLMNEGTIVMNKPQDKDEGIFQCHAYNFLGVSTSINVNFRQAMLEDFPGGEDEYISVERGRHVKLWCTPPTSIPSADITWHIRDRENGMTKAINLDNRITMDLEGRLYITNVQDEDFQDGKPYICMATNYIMRKNSISPGKILRPIGSEKAVNVAPHYLWSTPNEVFGVLGESLRIKCIFGGNPTPEVHWDNTTSGAIPDNRRTLSLGGQEVFISQLQLSDRGSYTCYTTSPLGPRQQRTIHVIVKSKPYWLDDGEPKDIETSVGAKATFICKAGGDPEPDIQWYINGQKFKDSHHITIQEGRLIKPDNHNITIVNLRLGDAMVLQCNASNTYGYVFADFYLNVLKERPQFIKRPVKELKVAENTNVFLTCQTSGKPDPIITWFKGNQLLTGGRYQIQPNGDLLIQNVVLSDAGNFTCKAENEEGYDMDWGVMIVRRATRIEQRPKDLEINAGWDAKFTCSGTTDFEEVANLRVFWMKDGKEISTANQRMTTNVQDNSLTISGTIARDSGLYTCVVTNGLDQQTSSAILTVKDKPEAPVNVRTKDCRNNKVSVLWTKGGFNNAPIQFFEIQFNTSIEPDNWVFAAYANQSANTITLNLHPGVTYSFRVIATNKIGESDPSKHSDICVTNPSKPRKNPGNVRGVGDKANYLIVEWTPMPPIEHGGRDFRYILRIWRTGVQPFEYVKTITNWRQNRYELLRNDIYSPYNVTIEAFNEFKNADAELKPVIIFSAESKPNSNARVDEFLVDEASMGDNSATFYWRWSMSRNDNLNGKFNGFKIQYWVKDMKEVTFREDDIFEKDLLPRYGKHVDSSTTEFRHTVKNLLPFTYMEAQICVTNTYFVSGPSPIVAFTTKPGVSGPVENLHPVVIGSNFIELQWSAPELIQSPNGLYFTGYDVGFQEVKGLNLGKITEMDPQVTDPRVTKAVLNGLRASTKYRVHMWARTAGGRGEVSFLEITTAPTSGMNVPSFEILNVNQTFFNITWTMTINKKFGTIAFVEYRVEGTSDWQQSPQEVSKSWIGIANLESGKSYEYRLAVTNGGKTSKSPINVVDLKGMSFAFSLGANLGWFLGFILSVITIIVISVLIVLRYKKRPDPIMTKPYTAPPRKRDDNDDFDDYGSKHDIIHKSSDSMNKGHDNYRYSNGYPDDDYRNRDSYDDRRYSDRYDDKQRYSDNYNRPYDDRYDDDEYDDRRQRYDDYDSGYKYDDEKYPHDDERKNRNGGRNVDYDKYSDEKRRYGDEKRYSDDNRGYSDDDEDQYRDGKYQSEPPPGYDRTPSYDKRTSFAEDVDLREPAKFDDEGYPIDEAATGKSPGKSSFV